MSAVRSCAKLTRPSTPFVGRLRLARLPCEKHVQGCGQSQPLAHRIPPSYHASTCLLPLPACLPACNGCPAHFPASSSHRPIRLASLPASKLHHRRIKTSPSAFASYSLAPPHEAERAGAQDVKECISAFRQKNAGRVVEPSPLANLLPRCEKGGTAFVSWAPSRAWGETRARRFLFLSLLSSVRVLTPAFACFLLGRWFRLCVCFCFSVSFDLFVFSSF